MKVDEQKAIEIGKIWMKKSIRKSHDYNHASLTLDHAIKIFPYFNDLDSNLVELACWWHDCYKSRTKKETIYSMFFEGVESKKIFETEVGNLISPKRRAIVSQAIERHNNFLWMIFARKRMDSLDIVLYEADQLAGMDLERRKIVYEELETPFSRFLEYILRIFLALVIKTRAVSPYTKTKLKAY